MKQSIKKPPNLPVPPANRNSLPSPTFAQTTTNASPISFQAFPSKEVSKPTQQRSSSQDKPSNNTMSDSMKKFQNVWSTLTTQDGVKI